jgi:Xaa-Pro aminopeptidase
VPRRSSVRPPSRLAAHVRPVLAALLAALLAVAPAAAAAAQLPPSEYAARRATVAGSMGDGVLLALGAPEPAQDYLSFYQDPALDYLAGIEEPGAALVMVKRGGAAQAILFVEPRDPAREVWSGSRLGAEAAARLTGMPARPTAELAAVLDSLLGASDTLYVVGAGVPTRSLAGAMTGLPLLDRLRQAKPKLAVRSAGGLLRQARGAKSPAELDLIRRAVQITTVAHRDAARLVEPGMNEFEVQALVEYVFRRNGADRPSFATIIGSGPNSTTLHYNRNDRFMEAGELVVMDIGASYRGYAADVTRTLPVSGTFTADQRAVYQIVRDAQAAAERQARVGTPWRQLADSASATIAAGLARLGLIEAPDATYECSATRRCPQAGLYFMHGLGHGIGLEVHDPDQHETAGRLGVGSVFTIEPGIYVRGTLLDVIPDTPGNRALRERVRGLLPRFADVGVRIEDDFIVTAQGLEWLSRGAPREAAEVEALMKEPWTGLSPRSPEMVEWYRTP